MSYPGWFPRPQGWHESIELEGEGQSNVEFGAGRGIGDPHASVVSGDHVADDGQAQADSVGVPVTGGLAPKDRSKSRLTTMSLRVSLRVVKQVPYDQPELLGAVLYANR